MLRIKDRPKDKERFFKGWLKNVSLVKHELHEDNISFAEAELIVSQLVNTYYRTLIEN